MKNEFINKLSEAFSSFGFSPDMRQMERFFKYFCLLTEKNKVMNLTAITEPVDVIRKHFLDSVSIIRVIPDLQEKEWSVLDIGTGAGFPGIPMAIMFPNLTITLTDSLNKRILFLKDVIQELGLEKNVTAIHRRAEDLARERNRREQYDLCVSRAVANLSTLSEYCLPFIHMNGLFIPYKSENVDTELEEASYAIGTLGGVLERVERFTLGKDAEGRSLVVIRKIRNTPAKYPRKAGIPSKEPMKLIS